MGYKVYDFWCEDCNVILHDELVHVDQHGDLTEEAPKCVDCGQHMTKLIPAPAGYVRDAGQMASKKALARAYRTMSQSRSYHPKSEARKDAEKEASHFFQGKQ